MLAVARRLIDLEIARVDNDAGRRVDRERHAVGNAVGDADELDRERSDGDALPWPYGDQLVAVQAVLFELRLDERERQRRAVDRSVDHRHHVRYGADMIFVTVRQHERGGAPFLLQVGQIRDDAIDAQQLGVRKHHAGIDDNRRLTPREREHVHPELAKSAERHDFEHQ